jgi:hypothetical protein
VVSSLMDDMDEAEERLMEDEMLDEVMVLEEEEDEDETLFELTKEVKEAELDSNDEVFVPHPPRRAVDITKKRQMAFFIL